MNKQRTLCFFVLTLLVFSFAVYLPLNVQPVIAQPTSNVPLTIILRNVNLPQQGYVPPNITSWVNSFVANHSYATAVTISDMHSYGIWWYGYNFSKTSGTWMGWTFDQLKTLIDRFHYHGWKVGIETTGIAWYGQQEHDYITTEHPELAFTDADGSLATGVSTTGQKNPGYDCVIPDPFAKFGTPDSAKNITAGTRLIDLYTTRLTQMIKDGLQWDFWFGTDGWNGFNNQGYYWNTATKSSCYSFSRQEENEWGNWTSAGMLPSNWASENITQRANDITQNSTRINNWWYYWQIRFAQMYAQIRQAFIDAGRPGPFYLIGTVDESSSPIGGNLSPVGMYNLTLLAEYNAVDYFYVDQESVGYVGATYGIGREEAYVGALAKMQDPNINPIIGLQPVDWLGNTYPEWEIKESYLAQAINYVWYNGTRYRVSDPTIMMMQYPSGAGWLGWTQQDVNDLFNWIRAMANILQDAQPLWLGPVYPIPNTKSDALGMAWAAFNFTFAQWLWTNNVQNNPQYIDQSMGTFLMDEALGDSGPQLLGCYDKMVNQLWGTGKLNLLYYECRGMEWPVSYVWGLDWVNESQVENNFHITWSEGSSANYTVLSGLTDPVASWIASGYGGTTCVIDTPANQYYVHGVYAPNSGFVSIASFTYDSPNTIADGYFKNSTTGNFLLTHMPSGSAPQGYEQILPRSMINKMLYWVSNCPVNSSQPLLDLKILSYGNELLIPMQNQKDVGDSFGTMQGWNLTSTLQINATALGLGPISNYIIYWADSSDLISATSWSNIPITLSGMADVLVVAPKFTITASSDSHSTITPSGIVSVLAGANQSFTMSANAGYHIVAVYVDGVSQGAITSYTFNNVQSNHTISVTSSINIYTIAASAGSDGSISPSGSVNINYGESQSFTIAGNTGYHIVAVYVDGINQGTITSYTFSNVQSNHTITASFAINVYYIMASSDSHSSISPSGSISVNYGSSQQFTMSAKTGYIITNVFVDGVSQGAITSYTFSNVQANHTISVSTSQLPSTSWLQQNWLILLFAVGILAVIAIIVMERKR